MRKRYLLALTAMLLHGATNAQTTCNPNGNLVIFSNYDGGVLNISVDVNMPNLKIGVCSYEAVTINLSGTYVNNVTGIIYAGYNSSNTHCGTTIPAITINGAPASATTSINFAPTSPVSNPYGYGSIICAYSCNTSSSQGGCNTIDQVEGYFLAQFPGSSVRMHKSQYGCWSGTQSISTGGNCCLTSTPVTPLTGNATVTASPTCYGGCNGTVTATASGGTPPYSYQWTGGPATAAWTNRCAGTYIVTITDAATPAATTVQTVVVNQPAAINNTVSHTACNSYFFNGVNRTTSGVYKDTLIAANSCDSFLTLNLTINTVNNAVTQSGATLLSNESGATYQWATCDAIGNLTPIGGATSSSYTATTSGQYALIVTKNGCTDTSDCITVTLPNGIESFDEQQMVSVYPNPTNDFVHIKLTSSIVGKSFNITDQMGKTVYQGVFEKTEESVSLKNLASGIYFLKIEGVTERVKVEKY